MAAEGELVDRGAFTPEVEDPDLNRSSQFFSPKNNRQGGRETKGMEDREESGRRGE
jgi:hypothetical protein